MLLAKRKHITTIYLFLWEDIDMAFDALLTHVRPAVA